MSNSWQVEPVSSYNTYDVEPTILPSSAVCPRRVFLEASPRGVLEGFFGHRVKRPFAVGNGSGHVTPEVGPPAFAMSNDIRARVRCFETFDGFGDAAVGFFFVRPFLQA